MRLRWCWTEPPIWRTSPPDSRPPRLFLGEICCWDIRSARSFCSRCGLPVLYEVFRVLDVPEEVRIQTCIGTSLAIIVPTTVRSYLGHKKKGAVIPEVVRIWALPAIIGVVIGSVTASFAPAPVFKIAFLFFATFIAVRMLFGGERWKLGNELPGRS